MIIQGSPEILRGPRGLNGFGDFGLPTAAEADAASLKLVEQMMAANALRSAEVEQQGIQIKAEAAAQAAAFASRAAARVVTDAEAQKLLDKLAANAVFLNNFDFVAENIISDDANIEFMKSLEFSNFAKSIPKLVTDYSTLYESPIFGVQPGGTFGPARDAAYKAYIERGDKAPVLTDAIALDLIYQASTTGAATLVIDAYGGYGKVKQTAQDAGYTGTPQNIQKYEIANNLPESASTILNKQFIGPEGEAKLAKLEAAISNQDEALSAQARADRATMSAAADAAFAAGEAARLKVVADAYAVAQAAAAAAAATKTQAALELRARALVAVKALYMQVLQREGDLAELNYFADRFGDVIDPDELQIFRDMSKVEIADRDKYLADMATTARLVAEGAAATANAQVALAASIAADATRAKAVADKAVTEVKKTVTKIETGDVTGINPMLILAAAAAAFFIGG